MQTLLSNAPIVFLQLAETIEGQRDVLLTPAEKNLAVGEFLNFTALQGRLEAAAQGALASGDDGAEWADQLRSVAPVVVMDAQLSLMSDCDVRPRDFVASSKTGTCASWQPAASANDWMYTAPPPDSPLGNISSFWCGSFGACLSVRCGVRWSEALSGYTPAPAVFPRLRAVDFTLEQRAGIGRGWPRELSPGIGEVVLGPATAAALGLGPETAAGVWVAAQLQAGDHLRWAFAEGGAGGTGVSERLPGNWSDVALSAVVSVPLRVTGVAPSGAGGKLPLAADDFAMVDLPSLGAWLAPRLQPGLRCLGADATGAGCPLSPAQASPALSAAVVRGLCRTPASPAAALPPAAAPAWEPALSAVRSAAAPRLADGAAAVVGMLPSSTRAAAYADGDVDSLQARLTGAAGRLVYVAGLSSLEVQLPLLDLVVQQRFVALYLSLVLNICLVVLFALAAMVIYSILTVSVAQRRFEIGVRRILGAGKPSLVALLTVQALLYALPGWALGLGFAALLSGAVTAQLSALGDGSGSAGVGSTQVLSGPAVLSATVLALAVPLLAALGPIRTALATSIREGLDAASGRGKAAGAPGGAEHVIERAGTGRPSGPLLALGLLAFLAGFALYYLLPLALLSLDLGLFLALFLCIFVGMLGGAAVLALNVQGLLQRALACACLSWWERGPVLRIALTNLGAHARRNRLTSLMYGLAVAFVVFTATVAQQQLQAEAYDTRAEAGTMVYAALGQAGQSEQTTVQGGSAASGPAAGSGLLQPPGASTAAGGRAYRGNASDAAFASPWTTGGAAVAGGELAGRMEQALRQLGLQEGQWGWGFVQADEWGVSPTAEWAGIHLAQSGPGVVTLPWDTPQSSSGGSSGEGANDEGIDAAGAVAAVASAVRPAAAVGWAGAEGLEPAERPTFAFGALSNLGRTSKAALSPQPVSPALFAAYAPEFVVLAGGDAAVPDGANVTAGAGRAAAERSDAAGTARLAEASRGEARPAGLAPLAPQRGGITAAALLYSPWGSSAVVGSGGLETALRSVPGSPAVVSTADSAASRPAVRSRVRTGSLLIAAPNSRFRRTSAGSSLLASLPLASRLAAERGAARPAGLVEPLRLHPFLGPGGGLARPAAELDRIRDALALAQTVARSSSPQPARAPGRGSPRAAADWRVGDVREEVADLSGALGALDAAFAALTAAAMFLCFFSLMSAMSTNVLEQSREVGVLLALGVRARALVRAYVHEATLLVASASTTGLLIGVAAAWTFGQQRALFTNQIVPLPVPWTLVIVVVVGSALCGLFAACAPAMRLVRRPVTQLLRSL